MAIITPQASELKIDSGIYCLYEVVKNYLLMQYQNVGIIKTAEEIDKEISAKFRNPTKVEIVNYGEDVLAIDSFFNGQHNQPMMWSHMIYGTQYLMNTFGGQPFPSQFQANLQLENVDSLKNIYVSCLAQYAGITNIGIIIS